MVISRNFSFLAKHDPVFLQLASTSEQVFAADPNTTLIKLRQLGEAIAQDLAARVRLGGRLEAVLETFADALWPSAA